MAQMSVPLLDLRPSFTPHLREAILEEMARICDEQGFILGPRVAAFEAELAEYAKARHAIGVSSGTDAQLLLLMAMGIGAGDAVLTTPYTFFATAGCIHRVGATPIFLDIEAGSFNLSAAAVEQYLRGTAARGGDGRLRTPGGQEIKAICPVHLYGQCADMEAFGRLGAEFGLPVLEDAAQALGADFVDSQGAIGRAGSLGYAGWYSFYPTKNLGGFGDAGATVYQDESLNAKMHSFRNHGQTVLYHHDHVGGNFRLDALQAAVLRLKLPHLDDWCDARRWAAGLYREAFAASGLEDVQLPPALWLDRETGAAKGARTHIYNQFVIRARDRDGLRAWLTDNGVGTQIYYPIPLHLQECFAYLGYQPGDFPESERAAAESLALPIFPGLTEEQIRYVVEKVAGFFGN